MDSPEYKFGISPLLSVACSPARLLSARNVVQQLLSAKVINISQLPARQKKHSKPSDWVRKV